MSDFVPRVRRGAHRPHSDPLRGLVPLLVALLAIALVGVGLALYRPGGSASTEPAPAGATPTATGNAAAGPGESATPDPGAAASATSSPSATSTTALPVTVLNATRRSGLGTRAANVLREEGWRVRSISNFRRGGVSATTVYYPAGYEGLARRLAASLPVPAAVQQRPDQFSSLVRSDRLTVVLAADYPS